MLLKVMQVAGAIIHRDHYGQAIQVLFVGATAARSRGEFHNISGLNFLLLVGKELEVTRPLPKENLA